MHTTACCTYFTRLGISLQGLKYMWSCKSLEWISRGVATGWTGVDMSTPLLPEVVPDIDANSVSFYSGGGGLGLRFREFVKYRE